MAKVVAIRKKGTKQEEAAGGNPPDDIAEKPGYQIDLEGACHDARRAVVRALNEIQVAMGEIETYPGGSDDPLPSLRRASKRARAAITILNFLDEQIGSRLEGLVKREETAGGAS
jgi:hypothetical protein